jgi:DNA-binding MarR family transcriptional regulator
LKAALGQKPQKHTSSSLIILKKSPAIIVTRNKIAEEMCISKGQVSKMAKKAIEAGRLIKSGRGYGIP